MIFKSLEIVPASFCGVFFQRRKLGQDGNATSILEEILSGSDRGSETHARKTESHIDRFSIPARRIVGRLMGFCRLAGAILR